MSTNVNKMFKQFSKALDYAIDIEGINAIELARRMNKDRSQISQWMNTDRSPQRKSIKKINNALLVVNIVDESTGYRVLSSRADGDVDAVGEPGREYVDPTFEAIKSLERAKEYIDFTINRLKKNRNK